MDQFRICKDCDYSGVYAIVNTKKNKIYIGSTENIKRRLAEHRSLLRGGKSHVKRMQEDYNNGDKFISYVITPVRVRNEKYCKYDDLRYFERIAIKEFKSTDPDIGYNTKENTGSVKLKEESAIYYAANDFKAFRNQKYYGYMQDRKSWNRERKQFINKVLN